MTSPLFVPRSAQIIVVRLYFHFEFTYCTSITRLLVLLCIYRHSLRYKKPKKASSRDRFLLRQLCNTSLCDPSFFPFFFSFLSLLLIPSASLLNDPTAPPKPSSVRKTLLEDLLLCSFGTLLLAARGSIGDAISVLTGTSNLLLSTFSGSLSLYFSNSQARRIGRATAAVYLPPALRIASYNASKHAEGAKTMRAMFHRLRSEYALVCQQASLARSTLRISALIEWNSRDTMCVSGE